MSKSHPLCIIKIIGVYLVTIGLIFVILAWHRLYNGKGLVKSGIYSYIRHPQYLGFIMAITGWLFLWPTLLTIIIYPLCLFVFIYRSLLETRQLEREYGIEFLDYKRKTPAFFPLLLKKPNRLPIC